MVPSHWEPVWTRVARDWRNTFASRSSPCMAAIVAAVAASFFAFSSNVAICVLRNDSRHWTPLECSSTRAVSTWLAGVAREDAGRGAGSLLFLWQRVSAFVVEGRVEAVAFLTFFQVFCGARV